MSVIIRKKKYEKWKAGLPEPLQKETDDYDLKGAYKAKMQPDEEGHLGSRNPKTGLLLKKKTHPTYDKMVEGEKAAGFEIYKKRGREYSRPKKNSK
jgi:hypothetical protein